MTVYKTDMSITTVDIYKKTEQEFYDGEQHMNITKYKKLNITEHKTDMNIAKIDKYQKTEKQFYDGAQST